MITQYKYRNQLLNKYLNIALVVSILISPVYYYIGMISFGIIVNIFSIVMYLLIKKSKDQNTYTFNSRTFMVSIFVVFIAGHITGNQEFNSMFFLLLFPIASFSIRGPKEGISWAVFLLLALIFVKIKFDLDYNFYSYVFFGVSYLMVSFLLYYYRYYEVKNFKSINDDLEDIIETRTKELKESNEQLKKLAATDALTQISNRAKLNESLHKEIYRVKRFKQNLAIIIIDIDHFKAVNDNYGHNVGDTLLIEFASILKSNTRESDIVGRWGGEEFLIICPETNLKGAMILAEHLRELISNTQFTTIGNKTASFGVSIYKDEEDLKTLISRADEALYNAKGKGRDRVESI